MHRNKISAVTNVTPEPPANLGGHRHGFTRMAPTFVGGYPVRKIKFVDDDDRRSLADGTVVMCKSRQVSLRNRAARPASARPITS